MSDQHTVLMLFQNQNKNENSPKALSKKPTGHHKIRNN